MRSSAVLAEEINQDLDYLMNAIEQKLSSGQHGTRVLSQKQRIEMSKKMTYYLRHNAAKAGLEIRSDGFVKMDALLNQRAFKRMGVTFEEMKHEVDTNDKRRFSMVHEEDGWYIRANQGHSIKCVNAEELLTRIRLSDASKLPVVCHGTFLRHWNSILDTGLSSMKRNHIHFVPSDCLDGGNVISGMRYECQLLIYIDLKAALKDGIKFYVSANNVILSSGIGGVLPPRYFVKATHFKHGKAGSVIWRRPEVVLDANVNANGPQKRGPGNVRGRGRGQPEHRRRTLMEHSKEEIVDAVLKEIDFDAVDRVIGRLRGRGIGGLQRNAMGRGRGGATGNARGGGRGKFSRGREQ